jgi:predicted Zn-dependent protease
MQGDSYQIAAEVLEGEGQVERAEALWRRATEVDPTNPTWLLRQAQALRALGRTADARATIARVVGRKWHERFWNVPGQARALKKQLDADR